jgi:hypothetical protein
MYSKIYFFIKISKVNRKKEYERKKFFEKTIKLIAPKKKKLINIEIKNKYKNRLTRTELFLIVLADLFSLFSRLFWNNLRGPNENCFIL